MNRVIGVVALAILLVAGGVVAYFYFTPPAAGQNDPQASREAADQFFADRGGTVLTDTMATNSEDLPGATGLLENIDGDTLTVKSPLDNSTTKIRVSPDTKILKDGDATAASIAVGDHLSAIGSKEGDTLTADLVQVGDAPQPAAAPVMRGSSTGAAPAISNVSGTVKEINGDQITLTQDDGSTTVVALTGTTTIREQVEIPLSDLATGDMIMAQGSENGDLFDATSITVASGRMTLIRP